MNTTGLERLEAVPKKPTGAKPKRVQLCAYVDEQISTDFYTKATAEKKTGTHVMNALVREYLSGLKYIPPDYPDNIAAILPTFVEFMQTEPPRGHLHELWKAMWTILEDRSSRRK